LSFPSLARRRNQRDFRGLSVVDRADRQSGWAKNKAARGTTKPGRLVNHRPNVEPYPRGCSPLQGFLLHRLGTRKNLALTPRALSTENAPYSSTLGRGFRGLACDESGWSLSRLPALLGFRTSSFRSPIQASLGSGVWFCLSRLRGLSIRATASSNLGSALRRRVAPAAQTFES
jgi:hypothetical protein